MEKALISFLLHFQVSTAEIDYLGREIREDGQIVTELTMDYDQNDSGNTSGIVSGMSGGNVSGGEVSGGDVSGGDVSGGDVSGDDVSGNVGNRIEDLHQDRTTLSVS